MVNQAGAFGVLNPIGSNPSGVRRAATTNANPACTDAVVSKPCPAAKSATAGHAGFYFDTATSSCQPYPAGQCATTSNVFEVIEGCQSHCEMVFGANVQSITMKHVN